MTGGAALLAVVFAAVGYLAGRAHFALLKRAVSSIAQDETGALALSPHLIRLLVTTAALGMAAAAGRMALLASLAGFLAARSTALRQAWEADP